MAQLRRPTCPICDGPNGGKWACPSCKPLIDIRRELIRNLHEWRDLFEAGEAPEVLVAADGRSYCLWDIDRLYAARVHVPTQQQRAIELCWYRNVRERDAAEMMGVSRNSPVAIYATTGLTTILRMSYQGLLPSYSLTQEEVA